MNGLKKFSDSPILIIGLIVGIALFWIMPLNAGERSFVGGQKPVEKQTLSHCGMYSSLHLLQDATRKEKRTSECFVEHVKTGEPAVIEYIMESRNWSAGESVTIQYEVIGRTGMNILLHKKIIRRRLRHEVELGSDDVTCKIPSSFIQRISTLAQQRGQQHLLLASILAAVDADKISAPVTGEQYKLDCWHGIKSTGNRFTPAHSATSETYVPRHEATLIVDLAQRHNQPSMSGFNSSISSRVPSDEQIRAAAPKLIRSDPAAALVIDGTQAPAARYALLSGLKATYVLVISNIWGYPITNYLNHGPPAQKIDAFRELVAGLARRVRDQNLSDSLVFDIWNEPNTERFSPGTLSDFYKVFLVAEHEIHGLIPDALVGGPSFAGLFNPNQIRHFLDFCLENGCEVNVLSWHENLRPGREGDLGDDIAEVADHIQFVHRKFVDNPQYAPLKLKKVHINEYGARVDQYRPGEAVAYLSAFERGGADAAARSCWDRERRGGKSNCFNASLNGLLGPEGEGNLAPWWVYRAYAAAVEHRVVSKSTNPKLAILAGVIDSPLKEEVQLLIGHTRLVGIEKQRLAPVLINMLHLDTALRIKPQVEVRVWVERIPNAGEEPISSLSIVLDREFQLGEDGSLIVNVGNLMLHEALIVHVVSTGHKK